MSKRGLILISLILLSLHCSAQKTDSLIQAGKSLRSNENYKQAIEAYLKALKIDKNSPSINYEVAYTYLLINDYKNAIKYCNRIIRLNQEKTVEAYILKGSVLDYMGKSKKSGRLYCNALKKFPNNYLLNYNLGITYYNSNQLTNAKNQFLKAIEIDKLQPNSHFMLGLLMNETGDRVQSMLSLYFFLMLEPNTERSTEAYKILTNAWKQNIEVDSLNSSRFIIKYSPKNINGEFSSIDLSVSSTYAFNLRKNEKGKNDYEIFVSNTSSFFNLLGDYKAINNDTWHTIYFKFFNDLFLANQVEPFCYYISSTCDDVFINSWLELNKDKIQSFSSWANNRLY